MTGKTWTDETVRALMRKHAAQEPEAVIEHFADQRRKEARQDDLPIDVDGIASLLGIKQRVAELPFAGRIYADPSGQLVMDLNGSDASSRRRFTCGHEIVHTAFPGFRREGRYRSDQLTGSYDQQRDEEEYLCDLGSAALLMPRALVPRPRLISVDVLEDLTKTAQVSLEAAGNRLVDLASSPVVMVVLEVGHKPADRPALRKGRTVERRLRVRYSRANGVDAYVPRFKSAEDRSPIAAALLDRNEICEGLGTLPGAERAGKFHIQAKAYPYTRPDGPVERVIALAMPADD